MQTAPRRKERLVFGRDGEVYFSADHYEDFIQVRGPGAMNPTIAADQVREENPELWNQIEYLIGQFDEFGSTTTYQGGAMGPGVKKSPSGELVESSQQVSVPGLYLGGGLPAKPRDYYTEADVWPLSLLE